MEPAGTHPRRGRAVREALLSLSCANVFYFRTWDAVLDTGRNIIPSAYAIAVANVLLISALFGGAYVVATRTRQPWVRFGGAVGAAALLLVPVHGIASVYFPDEVLKRNAVYVMGLVVSAAAAASRRVRITGIRLFAALTPLVVITFGLCVWRAAAYDPARWTLPSPSSSTPARAPRLLWMIFDEWDYGLTFDSPPAWLRTPELDRLTALSFHASRATSPGGTTDSAMPRLLTGDKGVRKSDLRSVPTIFSRAKAEGLRPAVSGWYIDYCGALARPLDACWTTDADPARNSLGSTPAEIALNQLLYLFENQYRSPFGQSFGTKRHALDYEFVTRAALVAVRSPAFDLVFVHVPIPHPPFFYDRTTGRYDLGDRLLVGLFRRGAAGYLDAIELVDRTIARVRAALESADMWQRTHVIISSDHSVRNRQQIRTGDSGPSRVPFIVRVAGSDTGVQYDGAFNTLVSTDLALALLRGEVKRTAEVGAFIDAWTLSASR